MLAITFTNKAAGELKERLERMLGEEARDVWAATFHAACVRILRRDIDKLGYDRNFTIYDTDDSKRVLKDIIKELDLEEKTFPPRELLGVISNAKGEMQSPEDFCQLWEQRGDWRKIRIGKVYKLYNKRLREANALDFDDIILHTVTLLQSDKDTREYYQNKFRYVLIDEYQDTNRLQYLLMKQLVGEKGNICVVGDDDQSIYKFRGADITNILNFEKEYKGCRTIRLEQNYRSTQNILDAANAVIKNNTGRKGKTLWTDAGAGDRVLIKTVFNEQDEANFVVSSIMMDYNRGRNWKENAILYRMNAQSRAVEAAMTAAGVALCILYIGIDGCLKGENALIAILSMVLGSIIGELLDLDKRMRSLGDWVQAKTAHLALGGQSASVSEGFVTASLLFCVGAMAIVGALNDGLTGDHSTLFAKSLLDGISSIVYGASLGIGVAFSAAAVFLYQGLIALAASFLEPFLVDSVIAEMTCVGSLMIVALAFNMLGITKIKVMNLVPAIFLPIFLCIVM